MKLSENMPPLTIYKNLIKPQHLKIVQEYLRWLEMLAKRGLHIKHIAPKSFNLLYRAVSRNWNEKFLLGYLQKEFIKENLSLSLLLEPLDGFEWLSKNRYPLVFSGSAPILLQIVTPLTRLIAALNNQHPPVYQPLTNLICAYISLYIFYQPDIKTQLKN